MCLLASWPSQVGAPYYPYRGTRRILPFGLMAKPGWAPLLPLQGDAPKFSVLGLMAKPGWAPLLRTKSEAETKRAGVPHASEPRKIPQSPCDRGDSAKKAHTSAWTCPAPAERYLPPTSKDDPIHERKS